ncbi:myelin and lymphocyte protein [Alligator mississippiensis]|uniref:Myelin and lymphocyte protein n=1 Tax=Alligator mississippiensis TaxID=8496 RepID=A0A151M1I8_ALLMI|nr:myelin and lymphocyte protein [Alligator mississippiensis]KYO18371.1 myelin and lymphocyte protein [Alligator mississippiensis]
MSSAATTASLPSGFAVLTSFPDILFIPEFIFGGLVWILVASTRVALPILQGWVMFVSVFCFVITTLLLFSYIIGAHGGKTSWITLDAFYHGIAALFYLSAAVLQAYATIEIRDLFLLKYASFKTYQEDIAAVVFAYLATLSYVIHEVFSLLRWKSS